MVNALIRAYSEQETQSQIQATAQASGWLGGQLADLKNRVDSDQQRLADFENQNGLVSTPEIQANGQSGETEHTSALLEIDELSRQLVAATTDRILSEAEYRAASHGDPEMVVASDPRLQSEGGNFATALLQQIHAHRSDLEQEKAQLSADTAPAFPVSSRLAASCRISTGRNWPRTPNSSSAFAATGKPRSIANNWCARAWGRRPMKDEAKPGCDQDAVMRQEANASHEVYMRVLETAEEAGLAAGIHGSNISVVDYARQPVKPIVPNLPLYFAITFFVGLWLAVGAALLRNSLGRPVIGAALFAVLAGGACIHAQAPCPALRACPQA